MSPPPQRKGKEIKIIHIGAGPSSSSSSSGTSSRRSMEHDLAQLHLALSLGNNNFSPPRPYRQTQFFRVEDSATLIPIPRAENNNNNFAVELPLMPPFDHSNKVHPVTSYSALARERNAHLTASHWLQVASDILGPRQHERYTAGFSQDHEQHQIHQADSISQVKQEYNDNHIDDGDLARVVHSSRQTSHPYNHSSRSAFTLSDSSNASQGDSTEVTKWQ